METVALAASLSLFPLESGMNYMKKMFMKHNIRSTSRFHSPLMFGLSKVCFSRAVSMRETSFSSSSQVSDGEMAPSTSSDCKRPRICILGGGFGGLYTALRLESLVWSPEKTPQVVLIDQSDRFVFKPMLYELLSGEVDEWEIAPRFEDLLARTNIQFMKDRVKGVYPSDNPQISVNAKPGCGGSVHLESGAIVEYDWLVLSLGAEAKLDVVPGASEFALPFSTLEDALRVDHRLKELERAKFRKGSSEIHVAVVGCGYTGVELAATISERLQNRGIIKAIHVSTTICSSTPPGNREAALKVLSSRNVQLYLGYFVSNIRKIDIDHELYEADRESTSGFSSRKEFLLDLQPAEKGLTAQSIEADVVLWTVGSKPLASAVNSEDYGAMFPTNARGQAETDDTLRVKGHPRIFAIGDSAAMRDSSGQLLPATAQVAIQQADFTGWNLWAAINGRRLLPFRFQNLGEMLTLGRYDAAISSSFIDGVTLEGPLGHTARKVAYLLRLPTDEHRLKVGLSWLTKSAIDSIALLQSTLTKTLS